MVTFKQIDDDQANELVDSVMVSIGAEDADSLDAAVIWMVDGDVDGDQGPLTVPEALTLATHKAAELGKHTVYVLMQPDTVGWDVAWGALSD